MSSLASIVLNNENSRVLEFNSKRFKISYIVWKFAFRVSTEMFSVYLHVNGCVAQMHFPSKAIANKLGITIDIVWIARLHCCEFKCLLGYRVRNALSCVFDCFLSLRVLLFVLPSKAGLDIWQQPKGFSCKKDFFPLFFNPSGGCFPKTIIQQKRAQEW